MPSRLRKLPLAGLAAWKKALSARARAIGKRERRAKVRDHANSECNRLYAALREHNERLQEANRCLVISSINAQMLAEQLQATKVELDHRALHDHLTSLPNRAQLKERLTEGMAAAAGNGTRLALLFIDLDHFKVINDSLGHAIGDQLLQAVAARLLAAVRSSDTVSRQGGDEFVTILADVTRIDELTARIEHIQALLSRPYTIDKRVLHVGASVGISIFPDDATDIDELMRNADIAMYSIKNLGRDGFAYFEPTMNERALARHHLEASLRTAVEDEQFVLHFQPQVELRTGRVSGAEVLLRWLHPQNGLLLPVRFVGFAEECGLIKPIGRWVLRQACAQAARWKRDGHVLDIIGVNISVQEFESSDFLDFVFGVLAETGLAPACLELELTEGALLKHSGPTIDKLDTLRQAGVRIAIDDFGTGYSSLSYLRNFPVDTLKIDQTFVADIHAGTENILLDAVIKIGLGLHHQVIAEGIETLEQLSFLTEHDCAFGQGFHLSRPMSAHDFTELLESKTLLH